jgi:hypothetical protein
MRSVPVLLSLAVLALASPLLPASAACNLAITVSCAPNGASSHCTSVTLNNGAAACTGLYYTGFEAPGSTAHLTGYSSGLTGAECFTDQTLPTGTQPLPFAICLGQATLAAGASLTGNVDVSGAPTTSVLAFTGVIDPAAGDVPAWVYAFANATLPTCTPNVATPPISQSGVQYTVSWSATSDPATTYVVDEATTADFSNATSKTVSGTSTTYVHQVTSTTTYYYRVHASSCNGAPGPVSAAVSTVVQAPPPPNSKTFDNVVPLGSNTPVTFQIFVPSPTSKTALDTGFTASTDKTYLTVSPATGTIPPGGTTLTVTANPTGLPPGANTGTVSLTTSTGSTINTPVSVSLVTPVAVGGKSLPPANALIIPIVGHLQSGAGVFQTDARLTNASNAPITYQISYAPANTDATQTGRVTAVTVSPSRTVALNDVAKDFFGVGAADGGGAGSLEIRPTNNSSLLSYASSRTFVTNDKGTYGQFVAAVPFSQFAGTTGSIFPGAPGNTGGPAVLSLQQVAQSAKFRTNLGLIEGSGSPASIIVKILDDSGVVKDTNAITLKPGELRQLDQYLQQRGISLDDGRIEITVNSGAVSAYASVLDNVTADPLEVTPVQVSQVKSRRYIVPGMAELPSPFANNFHSDLRVFNGGTSPVTATLTFYPIGGSAKTATPITIAPNAVKAFDNVVATLFASSNAAGSVVITTPNDSSLVATGRTYTIDGPGTFGQFIPGVTSSQGIGAGEQPLQLLQLEQSSRFRTNVGITELSGIGADVKLTVIPPDGRTSAIITKHLDPNEFFQFNKIIAGAYGDTVQMYNARIAVEVTGGSGRVAAYASVIDATSLDPTYVPAQ